jgi:hypothetical protein
LKNDLSTEILATEYLSALSLIRKVLVNTAYADRGTYFEKFLLPFKFWNRPEVFSHEIDFNLQAVAMLHRYMKIEPSNQQSSDAARAQISLLILCLKNRSEHAANGADSYPTTITVLAALFYAYVVIGEAFGMPGLRLTFAVIGTAATLAFGFSRLSTRREVTYIKEAINILEFFQKERMSESGRDKWLSASKTKASRSSDSPAAPPTKPGQPEAPAHGRLHRGQGDDNYS